MKRLGIFAFAASSAIVAHAQFFMPSGVRFSTAAASASSALTVPSTNGLYEVTFEESDPNATNPNAVPILATMFKRESNTRTPLWTARFVDWQVKYRSPSEVFVSDEGDFFVVTRGTTTIATLFRKDQMVAIDFNKSPGLFLSYPETFIAIDKFDGERIVRAWNRDKNSWDIVSAVTGRHLSKPIPASTVTEWNESQRRRIVERIFATKREQLRRSVSKTSPTLGKLAATAMRQSTNLFVTEGDYEFLSLQRNPDDRKWIEDLMTMSDEDLGFWPNRSGRHPVADYVTCHYVRAHADWLLGIWDKKITATTKAAIQDDEMSEAVLPRFQLGKIFGRVQFPLPINLFRSLAVSNPPILRILLIPTDHQGANRSFAADSLEQALSSSEKSFSEDLIEDVTFAFTTVLPGTYQLKAIWDKRAPLINVESAGPGDYESALSAPIQITPGVIISNIVLQCTNRGSGGDAYYAADEILRRKVHDTGEISLHSILSDPEGRRDTFSRKASYWIISNNCAPATNWARLDSIGTTTFGSVAGSEIPRRDRLVLTFRRDRARDPNIPDLPLTLKIVDEHGCMYEQMFYQQTARSYRFTFFQFPRSAKTWRLLGFRSPTPIIQQTNIVMDYTITNLVQTQRRDLAPKSLPADLNLGAVTMRVKAITGHYIEPTIDAEFFENGQLSKSWRIREAFVSDADGNLINPLSICRSQKTMTILGRAASESSLAIPFELTVDRPVFE